MAGGSGAFARLSRRATLSHIRHVAPVHPRVAPGPVAEVYRRLERDFGMLAPPVALHAPAPPALAASWLVLRETLLADGLLGRDVREAIAAAVSLRNRCPYCVEVHGATLAGLRRGPDARAVVADRLPEVPDPVLQVVTGWVRLESTMDCSGGPPLPDRYAPEAIGVAVAFHYFNRMVNVFLPDSPLPALPAPAGRGVRWVATRVMGRMGRRAAAPGADLDLLPDAPLPDDLGWAAGRAPVAEAFARASAAVEAAGERTVPEAVRQLVQERVRDVLPAPADPVAAARAVDDAVGRLPAAQRAAGRLALLTATASYRVTDEVVAGYRRGAPEDRAVVELTAWASLTAARAAGRLLHARWRGGAR